MDIMIVVSLLNLLLDSSQSLRKAFEWIIVLAVFVAIFQSWTVVAAVHRALINTIALFLLLLRDFLRACAHLGNAVHRSAFYIRLAVWQVGQAIPALLMGLAWKFRWLVYDLPEEIMMAVFP